MLEPAAQGRSGLLVVARVMAFEITSPAPLPDRQPAVPLSDNEIRRAYRGFDGQPWPDEEALAQIRLEYGLASMDQYASVLRYYRRLPAECIPDLVYLRFSSAGGDRSGVPPGFSYCGYDYGYYLSEWATYSLVYHEVIFGLKDAFRRYARSLNRCLLLPTVETVDSLASTRAELAEAGADLEDDEPFQPIAVWALDRNG